MAVWVEPESEKMTVAVEPENVVPTEGMVVVPERRLGIWVMSMRMMVPEAEVGWVQVKVICWLSAWA